MSRVIALCLLALASLALIPSPSAAADKTGIYVAPKFVYAHTVMDKVKGSADSWNSVTGGQSMFGSGSSSRESDDVFGGALAVGYDFFPRFRIPVRTEMEYAVFSEAEGKTSASRHISLTPGTEADVRYRYKQKLDIQTLFVNAYFDFKTDTPLTPYLGGGIGAAFIRAKGKGYFDGETTIPGVPFAGTGWGDSGSRSETNFAWNLNAGLAWEVNDLLTVDLGYRFAHLGEVKSGNSRTDYDPVRYNYSTKTEDLYMHQALLSLRFTF